MTAANRLRLLALALLGALPLASGCRQKMSDQPYHRPLEGSDVFADGRASRPLERGVVHRGQHLDVDPLVTGLTPEEWARVYAAQASPKIDYRGTPEGDRTLAVGAPRFDPPGFTPAPGDAAHPGPPVYVNEFPIPIDEDAVRYGRERFTIYCAVCHGPLGDGKGKLWERRYLQPTSFHVTEPGPEDPRDLPPGYSRNYAIPWRIKMPMPDAPLGYYFEVITKGVPGGGMPSYAAQIPPEDRWKIVAYIKVMQKKLGQPGGKQ